MYSFLRGEMVKAHISVPMLAKQIGVSEKTIRNKLNGETDFTWPEAVTIRRIVNPNLSIEEMFRCDEKNVVE
ncbi:MAG TPA: transcriptional regulator [Lachnospiraceae bacterium]|nr:transcriptional regulator [Lachnospiraceae bacterium]